MDEQLLQNPLDEGGGAPKWTVTFADLMSLLLCFFVLLLSFSETDPAKYKEVAGSMEQAFGVQRQLQVFKLPMGMKLIAKDFDQSMLRRRSEDYRAKNEVRKRVVYGESKRKRYLYPEYENKKGSNENRLQGARQLESEIRSEFHLSEGEVKITSNENGIRITLMGGSTFDSGKADIRPEMVPVLEKIGSFLRKQKGEIIIAGHTDNVPIHNSQFKSNLELSAGRSAAVAQFFISRGILPAHRIATMAFGEYRPVASNATPEGRSRNRRVEIILTRLPKLYPMGS